MYDFRKRTMFHLMWILSPQDLLQNRSLETAPACIVLQYYPHNNTVCIHMYEECKRIDRFKRLSQALVHFVIHASLFTDHKISGRPIRAKYKHFRTI